MFDNTKRVPKARRGDNPITPRFSKNVFSFELNGGKLMLSEKMTLSLTCLLLAFVLAIPPVMAGEFEAYFTPGELMVDVSSDDGLQVRSGRNRLQFDENDVIVAGDPAGYPRDADPALQIVLSISFDRVVQLGPNVTTDTVTPDNDPLQLSDFMVDAYDDLGRSLGALSLDARLDTTPAIVLPGGTGYATATPLATLAFSTPQAINIADPGELPGRQFRLTVDYEVLESAYNAATGGPFEIHTLFFTLKKAAVADSSIAAIEKYRKDPKDDNKPDTSKGPKFMRVDLVDDDEGNAHYATVTGAMSAMAASATGSTTPRAATGTAPVPGPGMSAPGVVDISRVDPHSGVAATATGAFDVRIVLTEEPAEFTKDHIMVLNGEASDPVALLPVSPGMGGNEIDVSDFPGKRYNTATALTGDARSIPGGATPDGDAPTEFPEPTGRDNMYHLYTVKITPKLGFTGNVTVWVKRFDDKVLPVPNEYGALTHAQILADTLDGAAEVVRDVRVLREVLSVPVQTAAAVDVFKPSADHLGANPRLKALPEKAVVPGNGYLVLARGKTDSDPVSGVVNVSAKPADKKTAASKLYNVHYDFGLPFPADDLSNFFRNGGTLQLLHVDIAGNTAGADGDKGYGGATTGAAAAGSLRISEIMWGLDGPSTNGQYIEIQNTTANDIGIDKNEWVIAVGAGADTLYTTVVDTVGNSAGWQVPGSDGNTKADAARPTVIDLVSMNRIGDDGTAEASWAASMRPSANIQGRRIGTPGAANSYVMPAAPEPTPEPEPEPMAPAAAADDIAISEIMVASNGGALPQWIELANGSGAAVSLDGWMLEIENDSADDDVVAADIEIDLSGITLGADQVALVISKAGRNSGVGDGEGDLRESRILDVQAQVSPDNARYSLISEMGFMLSLVPPRMAGSAIRDAGDSAGNLGGGWDIPMAEEGRSSLIRSDKDTDMMGTDEADWVLASSTSLDGAYRTTYYGDDEDMGTPGYDAGGALPVELSMFYAKRDPMSGAVVITWETQSELNNAGFFIKRSEVKNGKFVAVNPTMIAGAGTTAEKQSYTYTDASAKPNVVYYYQIEDVSLDGNRQTLTRAHRLRGHIGAAGKATTIWGELKSQE